MTGSSVLDRSIMTLPNGAAATSSVSTPSDQQTDRRVQPPGADECVAAQADEKGGGKVGAEHALAAGAAGRSTASVWAFKHGLTAFESLSTGMAWDDAVTRDALLRCR